MCGINGIISLKPIDLKDKIQRMNSLIVHRGPDDVGYFYDDTVAMGMQRLAIIDLLSGEQPIIDDTGNYIIVFNGEIYNYKILKEQLLAKGHNFRTTSDTEVLLYSYIEFGSDCLQYLNGMFAFSILDKVTGKLFIGRDRLGEKPLYYYKDSEKFVYASELKSIVNCIPPNFGLEMEKKALNAYFKYTFIPSPLTIYQNIFKLEPGCFLMLDTATLEYTTNKYWDIKPVKEEDRILSYDAAKKEVFKAVNASTLLRLESDVPLGVFLSGGIDSSIVAYSAASQSSQRIKTFSIGFSNYKSFDETSEAKQVAKHLDSEHYQIDLNFDDLNDDIDTVILNYDEPFADSSALPSYWVSKESSKYVKVALTGDGGDETFGGYNRYLIDYYNRKLFFLDFLPLGLSKAAIELLPEKEENRSSIKFKLLKLINSYDKNLYEAFFKVISLGFSELELKSILLPEYFKDDGIKQHLTYLQDFTSLSLMRNIDRLVSLDGDMCVKVDRASMLASIECRSPFLDHNLFELTNKFPDRFLLNGSNKKRILKDAFEDFLPTGLFNKPKSGFGIPVGTWLRNELRHNLLELTSDEFLKKQKIFNVDAVKRLVNDHLIGNVDRTFKIWSLYCFQKWYKYNFIKNGRF